MLPTAGAVSRVNDLAAPTVGQKKAGPKPCCDLHSDPTLAIVDISAPMTEASLPRLGPRARAGFCRLLSTRAMAANLRDLNPVVIKMMATGARNCGFSDVSVRIAPRAARRGGSFRASQG